MEIKYSLDKLVLDMTTANGTSFQVMQDMQGGGLASDVVHWKSNKMAGFKENHSVKLESGESFFFGVWPNNDKPNDYYTKCRLEYNPNKVGGEPVFEYIRCVLLEASKHVEPKRFDVAIDVPVDRRDIWLQKDQRQYRVIQNSEADKTEYLGRRSSHGQVKLYNKQIEAKLPYVFTRLEITVDYEQCAPGEFVRLWPVVRLIRSGQLSFDDMIMNDTDRVLVHACLDRPEYLRMLGRKMRKKIECILGRYTQRLEPDVDSYMTILTKIKGQCNTVIGFREQYRRYIGQVLRSPDGEVDLPW